jgi:elongator complex protein 1
MVLLTLELDIPPDDLTDERTRNIERGSKLVTVMPSVHSVVLQAPRGNLETVNPRFLVMASVRQSIEKKEFRAAFFTCRTHRIDMNILHEHEPELFLSNIPLFIQQLHDDDYIDLFLSSLKSVPFKTLISGIGMKIL